MTDQTPASSAYRTPEGTAPVNYHYVITIQFNQGRRYRRNVVHTASGSLYVRDGLSQKDVYLRIYRETVEAAGCRPDMATVLFYRAVPDPE